jgi:hypothetical protein
MQRLLPLPMPVQLLAQRPYPLSRRFLWQGESETFEAATLDVPRIVPHTQTCSSRKRPSYVNLGRQHSEME